MSSSAITATVVVIIVAGLVLGWILVRTSDRAVWRVEVTPEGLTLWPAGELVPESLPWSDVQSVALVSWLSGQRRMRMLRIEVHRQRRRIAVGEQVPGFDALQRDLHLYAPEVPYRQQFGHRRTWALLGVFVFNLFNSVFQLVWHGFTRRDLSPAEAAIWAAIFLVCLGVITWYVMRVRWAMRTATT